MAVEHIGSTSVPGLVAEDVIDLQVGVQVLADADDPGFVGALADRGFPRAERVDPRSQPELSWTEDAAPRRQRVHGSGDPGRMLRVYVRETDGPAWCAALLLRDWLRSEAGESDAYGALKRQLVRSLRRPGE